MIYYMIYYDILYDILYGVYIFDIHIAVITANYCEQILVLTCVCYSTQYFDTVYFYTN